MLIHRVQAKDLAALRLDPEEDLLLSLREYVALQKVKNAVIVSGVGSLRSYHYHLVNDTQIPPQEIFIKDSLPCDIMNVTGMIIDGKVHAHISLGDGNKMFGGHLEEGSVILTFASVFIMEVTDGFKKRWDIPGKL